MHAYSWHDDIPWVLQEMAYLIHIVYDCMHEVQLAGKLQDGHVHHVALSGCLW